MLSFVKFSSSSSGSLVSAVRSQKSRTLCLSLPWWAGPPTSQLKCASFDKAYYLPSRAFQKFRDPNKNMAKTLLGGYNQQKVSKSSLSRCHKYYNYSSISSLKGGNASTPLERNSSFSFGHLHNQNLDGCKSIERGNWPNNQNAGVIRSFATTCYSSARHRTYSFISSRSGIAESQAWRRNKEVKNNQYCFHNPSLAFKNNMQNNGLNSQTSNFRIQFLDNNKNIKERIGIHKYKGAKAVRGLRRKIQAQVTQKEDIRTIPNLLTTLRMASAPALAYLVVNDHFGCALSIFVLAGFTDMLDGYIARNFKNQRTAFGTALDPLADKLLISCLTISLTSAGLIPVPLTALIVSRDAGLIIASFIIRYASLSPPRTLSRYFDATYVSAKLFPSTISKINTGIQLSYVACVLAAPVFGFVDHPYLQALMYTTAASTFLSGLDYLITWRRRLKIIKNK